MTRVAIISEYNPFHLGHEHQICQIRHDFGEDTAILAFMSGNFVQRGTPAVFDKYNRAKAAVLCGVNLVLEYPFPFCVSGANYFARFAVSALTAMGGIDYLSFGVEGNQIEDLVEIANLLKSKEYDTALKETIANCPQELGYAELREQAIRKVAPHISPSLYQSPNNILALEYLSALAQYHSPIKPHFVTRTVDYHSPKATPDGFASASYIRQLIMEKNFEQALQYCPNPSSALFQSLISSDLLAEQDCKLLGKMMLSSIRLRNSAAQNIFECTDELSHRIFHSAQKANSYQDLIQSVQTPRYTTARIRRALLHTFFGTKIAQDEVPAYATLLGADQKGMTILKEIHQNHSFNILTKPSDTFKLCSLGQSQAEFCAKADRIYSLLVKGIHTGDEFQRSSPYCVR